MIVRYLDLKTGRKASETGVTADDLMNGNWSCDCNRAMVFGKGDLTGDVCDGATRFIVFDVEAEPGEALCDDVSEIIRDANSEYYANACGNVR